VAYANDEGVLQDDAQAVYWYRKAAEQGYVTAQAFLGAAYDLGKGVTQDYAQAAAWYRKAAEQGDTLAQWGLGLVEGQA
jgi:TPR repeat protein